MPTTSASEFIRFKRVVAIQHGDTQARDPKSVNRLTQYNSRLSNVSSLTEFVTTPSLKSAQPRVQFPFNYKTFIGKIGRVHQRCS